MCLRLLFWELHTHTHTLFWFGFVWILELIFTLTTNSTSRGSWSSSESADQREKQWCGAVSVAAARWRGGLWCVYSAWRCLFLFGVRETGVLPLQKTKMWTHFHRLRERKIRWALHTESKLFSFTVQLSSSFKGKKIRSGTVQASSPFCTLCTWTWTNSTHPHT